MRPSLPGNLATTGDRRPDQGQTNGVVRASAGCRPRQFELTLRVPDCRDAYEVLRARGAEFLTPPVDWGGEIRAFFRDPDGHLLEISEAVG